MARSKESRKAALEAIRARRNGLSSSTRTDEYEVQQVDDVYDVYEEDDYRDLVQRRREREDFVVDDDGLGYHDDGEENHFHDDNQKAAKAAKKRAAQLRLTAKALKKARHGKELSKSSGNGSGNGSGNSGMTSSSMWDFVKPGAGSGSTITNPVSRGGNGHREETAGGGMGMGIGGGGIGSSTSNSNNHHRMNQGDIDSLLGELDTISPPSRRRGGSRSRGRSGRSSRAPRPSYGRGERSSNARRYGHGHGHGRKNDYDDKDDYDEDNDEGAEFHVADADVDVYVDAGVDMDVDTDTPMDARAISESREEKENDGPFNKELDAEVEVEPQTVGKEKRISSTTTATTTSTTTCDTTGEKPSSSTDDKPSSPSDDNEVEPTKPKMKLLKKKRSNLSNRMSVAAKQALEKETSAIATKTKTADKQQAPSTNNPAITATSVPEVMDKNSASFNPTSIASANSLGNTSSKANLDSIIQEVQIEDTKRTFVDMYWIDAYEKNGLIYLYGKTPKTPGSDDFVSICTVISGNQHNLFVLPRPGAEILDVHNEIKKVLQPKCIPQVSGASFGSKVVKRKYAFGDQSIPREETQYLKVVYDAKYSKPEEDVCAGGGKSFSKILNAGATTLETFILKRRLMGPCWIRVYDPSPTNAPVSWCKIECTIGNPKDLIRCDLDKDGKEVKSRPAPPLKTVTLKLKTVVNPKSNKSEVISVSAICHQNINIDSSTNESQENMSQLSLIRPLGVNISSGCGGLPQFPRDLDSHIKSSKSGLQKMSNERALLNRLLAQIGLWDPDVLVGHNAWGYDVEVLLTRCIENKVAGWSKIGRRRFVNPPKGNFSGKDWAIADALKGRLLCDTYVSSKELLRETTYSLTSLAVSQLKTERVEIEPVDIPQWFNKSSDIVKLAMHTLRDAQLVQRLMLKLQVLPLTKQLTSIAGNLWCRTMKGNRAERNEFLLLHEFHRLKYIVPEKVGRNSTTGTSNKAKYSGGLVLEPKKGLYDTFILLLDFNSLYPSIIREYNLCFTTSDWSQYVSSTKSQAPKSGEEDIDVNNSDNNVETLPPLPDESLDTGVLPRVIKTLIQRRREVKKILKKEKNPDKQQELDIRQMALKLTANSMYGCLGFSHSRFYAQPIAALITAMGREILQRTVTIAQDTVGLDVIYGDTDSIMINTRVPGKDLDQLKGVYDLGARVKKEVNRLYKTLELEIDGVFRSMLLLKKKKYAAVTISTSADGKHVFGTEKKGLDLVRRDWCIQSKETGEYVLDQILSSREREETLSKIHDHLEEIAKKMRNDELPLEKYVITKGLSKHPDQYPDAKSQPHVQVAKMMLKAKRPVNTGDHIPYVITQSLDQDDTGTGQKSKSGAADRARHPEEIHRSAGNLKPDIEWYLTQQILPPISRLCECIDGTSQAMIAKKLGLDASRFNQRHGSGAEIDDSSLVKFTPASFLADTDRYKDVDRFLITCQSCSESNELKGVFIVGQDKSQIMSGYQCPNPQCSKPNHWGYDSHFDLLNVMSNKLSIMVRKSVEMHGKYECVCEDPSCKLKTRQLSVSGKLCLNRGCNGCMEPIYNAEKLDTQVKYLKSLFDLSHCYDQYVRFSSPSQDQVDVVPIQEVKKMISKQDQVVAEALCEKLSVQLKKSAYNIIDPDIFRKFFSI